MVKKRIKYAHRYQEILNVLFKNGFGFLLKDLGFSDIMTKRPKREKAFLSQTMGERIRISLEELGPTFVKLGQIASTRLDLFPESITIELSKLQDTVPPVPFKEIEAVVSNELDHSIDEIFREFSQEPVASASIGQVHHAVLLDGTEVAVKVQRPKISETIEIDIAILLDLARLLENKFDWARNYQVTNICNELAKSLQNELNYIMEGTNAEKLKHDTANKLPIEIPNIHWDYTTTKVLTMDYIKGQKIQQFAEEADKREKQRIADVFVESMFQQIFIKGFFHGDPHPGNLFVTENGQLAYVDFGMVGRLHEGLKVDLASILIAINNRDIKAITDLIIKIGSPLQEIDEEELHSDIEQLFDKYINMPVKEIPVSEFLKDLFQVSFTFHIQMPASLTLLGKAFFTMEAIIMKLDADLSMLEIAESFGQKIIVSRFKPKNIFKELEKKIREINEIFSLFQSLIKSTSKNGKIRLEVHLHDKEDLVHTLDRIINQLSFSIVLLSFSLLMGGLIIGSSISREKTILWEFPVIEIGSFVATMMFLWLLYGIIKSGRF